MKAFDTEKTVSYWFEGANYDLGVANAMLESKKYPYVLFMGHLSLKKLLKAFFVKHTKTHAPFSHSLPYLAEKSGVKMPERIVVKLREFMEFRFEARYRMRTKCSIRNARKPILLKN